MISKHKRLMQTQSYGRGNINATSRCQSTQIKIHRNTNLVYANGKITKYKNKLHFWKISSGAHVTNTFKNIVDPVNNTFNGPSDAEQLTRGLFSLIFLTHTHSPFFLPSIAVAISHCLTLIVWPQSIKGHFVLNARRGVFAKSLSGWAAQDRQGGEGWWCIISTTIWCPAWLPCHSHIQRTFPSTRSWIVHNTKLVNDIKKVRDAKETMHL